MRITIIILLSLLIQRVQGNNNEQWFDVPPLSVNEALITVAKQADLQLLFDSNLTHNLKSMAHPVHGTMAIEQALQLILDGSKLEYQFIGNILIVRQKIDSIGHETKRKQKSLSRIEEVLVAGFPLDWPSDSFVDSLKSSAAIKASSAVVMDNVVAKGLGQFDTNSVSEALQRIPGIAISRDRGGDGRFVTVRGLGEEFNLVTYNERLLPSENDGREVSFDLIAPELIANAQIYKTSAISQLDGGLGGVVNINSVKPLDNPGFHAVASVAMHYESLADTRQPNFSSVVSHTWDNNEKGVIVSLSYLERDIRTDIAESNFLLFPVDVDAAGNASQGQDLDGDGVSDVSGLPLIETEGRFNGFSALLSKQKRQRIGATLAYQYKPNDGFEMVLDALYNKLSTPSLINGYSYFPSAFNPGFSSNVDVNETHQIVSHTSNAFAYDALARRTEGDTETIQLGGNFSWQLNNTSAFTLDASYSKADGQRDNAGSAEGSGSFFALGVAGGQAQQTFTGREVPDFIFNVPNPDGAGFISSGALRAQDYRTHFGRNSILRVEDEVISLKGDYDLELTDAATLQVGVSYIDRQKINRAFTNAEQACALCGYAINPADSGVDISGLVIGSAPSDFLSGVNASIPRQFDLFDLSVIQNAYRALAPEGTYTSVINEASSTNVKEAVLGAYIKYDWSSELVGLPYNANMGVRVVQTKATSRGFSNQISDITEIQLLADGTNQNFTVSPPRSLSINNNYTDILPALNINVDLTSNLIFRGALSKTVSRPTVNNLSTSFLVSNQNLGGEAVVLNNPLLNSIESNNVDFSLEWYSQQGSYASAALFYKDVSNFIGQVVTTERVSVNFTSENLNQEQRAVSFRVERPENNDQGQIWGLELGGQYLATNGWGSALSLTLLDSQSDFASNRQRGRLENLSDVTAHFALFYENKKYSARLVWNYRSDYLVGQTSEGGRDEIVDDSQRIDVSFDYQLTDSLTLYLEGNNVFEEPFFRYSETRAVLESYEETGSHWLLGLRAHF